MQLLERWNMSHAICKFCHVCAMCNGGKKEVDCEEEGVEAFQNDPVGAVFRQIALQEKGKKVTI